MAKSRKKSRYIIPMAALSIASLATAEPVALTVHTDQTTKTVDVQIYGQFLEHIFNSVHGGIWGDQILNGTLEPGDPPRRGGRGPGAAAASGPATGPAAAAPPIPPRNWEFVGAADEVDLDRDNPLNAGVSVRISAKVGGDAANPSGIRQRSIALKEGEKYTLSLYARGSGSVDVTFQDGATPVFSKSLTGLTPQWRKFTVEFTAPRTVDAASLTISAPPAGPVNVDQIALFAGALATGGYRPDLLKAIADLQPASIRWPGGSFANRYIWQNGVGPREKRLPHPIAQWNDRDTYQAHPTSA